MNNFTIFNSNICFSISEYVGVFLSGHGGQSGHE
jgi:hypothetical protein